MAGEIDRDALTRYVAGIAAITGDVEQLRQAQEQEYAAKRAEIELLIEDRRVVEIEVDGHTLLQYQLTYPLTMPGGGKIETLTPRRPTVGTVRSAARYSGDEWAAYLIRTLCKEIPDDETLDKIDGSEWDDIVTVVRFPFVHPPSRAGGKGDSRPSSGGKP